MRTLNQYNKDQILEPDFSEDLEKDLMLLGVTAVDDVL